MIFPTVLLRRGTVLVVDDEEQVRHYVARVIQGEGYEVITAGDGDEALQLLGNREESVGLVITDVSMPRMSGPELATHLARRPSAPSVLFVSGTHPGTDLPGPLLAKPFLPEELSRMVRRLMTAQPRLQVVSLGG